MVEYDMGLGPGHGSDTFPGSGKGVFKKGKGYAEHTFNSKLTVRLNELLEANGLRIFMAQKPFSPDVPLQERKELYKQAGVKFVFEPHANANADPNVNGICSFYWNTNSKTKEVAEQIAENVRELGYDTHGNGIHASAFNSWTNLYVTRAYPMDSVLTEHGFMTGNKDFDLIFGKKQDKYVEDMAHADAKAILAYFGKSFNSKPSKGETVASGTFYRVQVGAFKDVAGIAAYAHEVEKRTGFDSYVTEVDGWLKVQVGAFIEKDGAEERLKAVHEAGYKDAFITTKAGKAVPETEPYNDPVESAPSSPSGTSVSGAKLVKNEDAYFLATSNIKVRNKPTTKATHTGTLPEGASINYKRVFEGNGYRWLEYTGNSGNTLYLPYRRTSGDTKSWGTFHSDRPETRTIDEMAKEIINNPKAPNGHENRRKWLGISKSEYEKVRRRVNQLA